MIGVIKNKINSYKEVQEELWGRRRLWEEKNGDAEQAEYAGGEVAAVSHMAERRLI